VIHETYQTAFNLASDELVSYSRIVESVGRDHGKKIEPVRLPAAEINRQGIPLPFPLEEHLLYSGAKIRQLFGIEYMPFKKGLREALKYYLMCRSSAALPPPDRPGDARNSIMSADLVLCNLGASDARLVGGARLDCPSGKQDTFMGAQDALGELSGPKTQVLDCQGGMVLPGFNDAHCHPIAFAMTQRYLDCSARQVGCISDIQAILRKQAGKAGKERWLRGAQLDATAIAESNALPNRWELTRRYPISRWYWWSDPASIASSTAALSRCGIDDSTLDSDAEMLGRDYYQR